MSRILLLSLVFVVACQKSETKKSDVASAKTTEAKKFKTPQVEPPLDLKNPPADAVRTPSGLIYKTLVANAAGQAPKRNDTVMIKYGLAADQRRDVLLEQGC